jgi:hypothetical protein
MRQYAGQLCCRAAVFGGRFGTSRVRPWQMAPGDQISPRVGTLSAIWTNGENTDFTFVNDDGSNVRPRGQVLGKLGRTMGGSRVATSVGSGLSNVLCMASLSGANWAVWLTNYDTSNNHTVNVQGLTGSTYNYWECSATNPMPVSSTNPSSTLANLTIPSRSVVVLSNF